MTTGTRTAGRLIGPLQVGIARSIDPVVPSELAITRVTKTQAGHEDETEMGSKWIVPYGLRAARIQYSAPQGKKTGVTEEDLSLLWTSLQTMWDHTRSASRTNISTRGLYVFTHASSLGNAPAASLLDMIKATRTTERAPRAWTTTTSPSPTHQLYPTESPSTNSASSGLLTSRRERAP